MYLIRNENPGKSVLLTFPKNTKLTSRKIKYVCAANVSRKMRLCIESASCLLCESEEDEGEVEEDDPEGREQPRPQHGRVRRHQLRRQTHHLQEKKVANMRVQVDTGFNFCNTGWLWKRFVEHLIINMFITGWLWKILC